MRKYVLENPTRQSKKYGKNTNSKPQILAEKDNNRRTAEMHACNKIGSITSTSIRNANQIKYENCSEREKVPF